MSNGVGYGLLAMSLGSRNGLRRWTRWGHQASLGPISSRPALAEREALLRPSQKWSAPMPTYEYRCRDCHNVFDRTEPLAEHGRSRPECPKCKSKKVEQVLTSFFAKTSHKS
jgi:putative FmdB family regulatory protein